MNNANIYFKYRVFFEKKGLMVYISHLDLMTLIRRAIRRAALPFVLTKGFTPRVRISMPRALKLGVESGNEEMVLWLGSRMIASDIGRLLNSTLPEGVRITEVLGL